jgi:hypothetical protein
MLGTGGLDDVVPRVRGRLVQLRNRRLRQGGGGNQRKKRTQDVLEAHDASPEVFVGSIGGCRRQITVPTPRHGVGMGPFTSTAVRPAA